MNNKSISSTKFQTGSRTYFFDLKETDDGRRYLKIVESKYKDEGSFERYPIIVPAEAADEFLSKLSKVVASANQGEGINEAKSYSVEEKRSLNPNAYKPWTEDDDNLLELLYAKGSSMAFLMKEFGRNKGAIRSRIKKLGLEEKHRE